MSEQAYLEHCVLFVGNLPYSYVDSDLQKLFVSFDGLTAALIVRDERERSRGFGFVHFENLERATVAKDKLDCTELEGRKLRISFARKESPYVSLIDATTCQQI